MVTVTVLGVTAMACLVTVTVFGVTAMTCLVTVTWEAIAVGTLGWGRLGQLPEL